MRTGGFLLKPGFHMIVTIVAIATIVQKFDWTIATILTILTILTIHGFHMIVAIAAVFMVEYIKADDGCSVFTSVVTNSISLNSESTRSPFKIACYLFVYRDYIKNRFSLLRYRPLRIQL